MRTKFIYIIIILIVGISCKKEESANVNHITFSAYDGTSVLKTAFDVVGGSATTWNSGDVIGVYMSTVSAPTSNFLNYPYTATATGSTSTFTGTLTWQGAGTLPTYPTHTFYAYYPRAGTIGSPAYTAVPISLSAAQNGTVAPYDFLYATATADPIYPMAYEANVAFAFKHAFTIFEFDITVGSLGAGYNKPWEIMLSSTSPDYIGTTGGTINLTNGIITPGTAVQSITLTTANAISTAGLQKFYMVVYPKNFTSGTNALTVSIKTTNNKTVTTLPANITKPAGWSYSQGNKYTLTFSTN